jgi:glycogen operon protein
MILAGDEFGNSQNGNNNAYAQDNETGWLDWSGLQDDPGFLSQVQKLIRLRRNLPLLRQATFLHGRSKNLMGCRDIEWLDAEGERLSDGRWRETTALTILYCDTRKVAFRPDEVQAIAALFNVGDEPVNFLLPDVARVGAWYDVLTGSGISPRKVEGKEVPLVGRSSACFVFANAAPAGFD